MLGSYFGRHRAWKIQDVVPQKTIFRKLLSEDDVHFQSGCSDNMVSRRRFKGANRIQEVVNRPHVGEMPCELRNIWEAEKNKGYSWICLFDAYAWTK